MTSKARLGDRVWLTLRVATEDGTVHDEVSAEAPLEFTLGDPILLPAITAAIVGCALHEERTINISPERGYGLADPRRQKTIDRELFPGQPVVGAVLDAMADGGRLPLRVVSFDERTVTLDANPPLAGRTLIVTFKVQNLVSGSHAV